MKKSKDIPWEKADFQKANVVKIMAAGEGYKVLAAFWLAQREVLISKATDDKCLNRELATGELKGFNLAVSMAERVVNEAIRQKEDKENRKKIEDQFD